MITSKGATDPIYLDNNATAPLDPRVRAAMEPFLAERFGNSKSTHAYGTQVRAAIERARDQVAQLLGSDRREIIFTSGGSESNNQAIKGILWAKGRSIRDLPRGHAITSRIEHASVREALAFLSTEGFEVTAVGVDARAQVDPGEMVAALRPDTLLVTLQHANNEVGTIQPIARIANALVDHPCAFHVDAAQSVGKIPVKVRELGCDVLTVAAHKLCGPQGIGALFIRDGVMLTPLVHGVGHEAGVRSGTLPVALIVGLGEACAIADRELAQTGARMAALRDRLWERLASRVPDVRRNGHPTACLPHTLSVSFRGVDANLLLLMSPGLAASTGAACHSGRGEMPISLVEMGAEPDWGLGAVRLSLGRFTTEDEIDRASDLLAAGVMAQRAASLADR